MTVGFYHNMTFERPWELNSQLCAHMLGNDCIHVRVRLEKSLEKVKKRLKKYSQKILQVV